MNLKRLWILGAAAIFSTAIAFAAALVWIADPDWIPNSVPKPPFARSGSAADDSALLTEYYVEEIARAWTMDNINGAAGDELAKFIVSESNTAQPDMFFEYLKERLESVTTWNYGPIKRTGENRYETTATATTRVHDTMDPPIFTFEDETKGARGEALPTPTASDVIFTRIAKMPFSLTVDLESNSVTDWQARLDEANETTRIVSERFPNAMTVEELYGDAVAECVNAAMRAMRNDLPDSVIRTLFLPPSEREEADAARAKAAVESAGIGDVCENWIGE